MQKVEKVERELADVKERLAALERLLTTPPESTSTAVAAGLVDGTVRYSGALHGPDIELAWDTTRTARELLDRDPARTAQTLAALANPVRHQIVRALLDEPRSARDLQQALELSSQGHTHYHLKELIAAGLVRQHKRGSYTLEPAAVIPYLALLAACADLDRAASEPTSAPANDPDSQQEDSPATAHPARTGRRAGA